LQRFGKKVKEGLKLPLLLLANRVACYFVVLFQTPTVHLRIEREFVLLPQKIHHFDYRNRLKKEIESINR
jgi:hypothetical protein